MVDRFIKRIAEQLDAEKIPYMIIGGQALVLYGRFRATLDIDITIGIDIDKFSVIEKICKILKFKFLVDEPENFAKKTRVLPAEDPKTKLRVDFIFSFLEYESDAIKRAQQMMMSGYPVKFATCEDIIIHKMIAGRAVDEEDVKSILIRQSGKINLDFVKEWLRKFEVIPEFAGVLDKFEKLLEL